MSLIDRTIPAPPAWPPPRDRAGVDAVIGFARRRDPVGDRVHAAFAYAYLVMLPLWIQGSAVTFALLVGYALLRAPSTWRCYPALLRMPVLGAFAAWIAWAAVAIAWSDDPGQGWDEVQAARVILTPLALWPILDRVPRLIGAALIGVAAHNGVQLLQAFDVPGFHAGEEGRLEGTMHAIQTGAWCAAAMCWHLGAALVARRGLRWLALAGFIVAAAGLVGTGSRGPWISAAVAVPLLVLVTAARRRAARRPALVLVALGLVGAATAWPVAGRMIGPRVESAIAEVRDARDDGVYWTSTGLRLVLWKWAWSMYRDAPVIGKGTGSFQDELWKLEEYATLRAESAGGLRERILTRDHAHSTLLHTLATQGTVGGVLLALLVTLAIVRATRDPDDHLFADATLFVLVTWLVGSQFDCYHLNGQVFGMFALAVTTGLAPRPGVHGSVTDAVADPVTDTVTDPAESLDTGQPAH